MNWNTGISTIEVHEKSTPSVNPKMKDVDFLDARLSKLSLKTHMRDCGVCFCVHFALPPFKQHTGLLSGVAEGVGFSWSSIEQRIPDLFKAYMALYSISHTSV